MKKYESEECTNMSNQVFHVTQKTHSKGQVHLCQRENNRDESMKDKGLFELSNIDWNKTNNNYYFIKSDNFWNDFESTIAEYNITSYKSNSVKTINGVITFSPDILEKMSNDEMMNYFQESVNFLNNHMGKVINAVIHFDEKTPHMHFTTVPIVKRNDKYVLCARDICGGKHKMSQLQTDFNNEVAYKYGLERGVKRTPTDETRKHKGALEHQLDTLQNQVDELTTHVIELTNRIKSLDKDKKELVQKNITLQKDNSNLNGENQYLLKDNDVLNKKNKELIETIDLKDSQLATLENELATLKDKEYYQVFINALSNLNQANKLINSKQYNTAKLYTNTAEQLLNTANQLYQMEQDSEEEYER